MEANQSSNTKENFEEIHFGKTAQNACKLVYYMLVLLKERYHIIIVVQIGIIAHPSSAYVMVELQSAVIISFTTSAISV